MYFTLAASKKDFLDWLSAHYFVRHHIIHKFEPKTLGDGREFYQYGTPKPPIVTLRIFVEQKDSSIGVAFEVLDRPGNVLDAIDCQEELIVSAKLEYSNLTSPPPTAQ